MSLILIEHEPLWILKTVFRTDPSTMDIYLVNQHVYPNTQELIASGVDTSLGHYTIKSKNVGGVDTGYVVLLLVYC